MKNKNGFTLAEMVAVIAILMVLALLSSPFVRGYIDDSYNGKAQIFLRQLNEARLNFERDYPGTTVSGDFKYEGLDGCNIETIYGQTNLVISPEVLVGCHYLQIPSDLEGRYNFAVGSTASCSACTNPAVASMIGSDESGRYKDKCACVDNIGVLYKEKVD